MGMSNCVVCQGFSGRREICQTCIEVLYPHRVVNAGAKALHRKLIPVPRELAGRLISK